jgi:hypothetical protein
MKKVHPTHGVVTVVKTVNDTQTMVKLANGVNVVVTTGWLEDLPVATEKSDAPLVTPTKTPGGETPPSTAGGTPAATKGAATKSK